jgi:hypothetical protein
MLDMLGGADKTAAADAAEDEEEDTEDAEDAEDAEDTEDADDAEDAEDAEDAAVATPAAYTCSEESSAPRLHGSHRCCRAASPGGGESPKLGASSLWKSRVPPGWATHTTPSIREILRSSSSSLTPVFH